MFQKVIAIFGVPRSGTSWLGQIIDSCPDVAYRFQPLFSYRFKNRVSVESKKNDIDTFFYELYQETGDEFLNQTDQRKKGLYPNFEKNPRKCSVLAFKEVRYLYMVPIFLQKCPNMKIVGIIRNPYDVLESWINAPSEYKSEWKIEDEWRFAQSKNKFRPENYYGYYKWKEWIKLDEIVRKAYPNQYITISYEALENDAEGLSKNLFKFLDLPYTQQTKNFIVDSQNKTVENAYGVFRKKGEGRIRKCFIPENIKKEITQDLLKFEEAKLFVS